MTRLLKLLTRSGALVEGQRQTHMAIDETDGEEARTLRVAAGPCGVTRLDLNLDLDLVQPDVICKLDRMGRSSRHLVE